MRTFIGSLLLAAVVAVFAGIANPPADAQEKKEKKKDAKKGTGSPVIEIGEGRDGKFRFFVRDGEGTLLAMSGRGFSSAKDAEKAVAELKKVLATAKVVMLKKAPPKA